jgi:hypothetical protein
LIWAEHVGILGHASCPALLLLYPAPSFWLSRRYDATLAARSTPPGPS